MNGSLLDKNNILNELYRMLEFLHGQLKDAHNSNDYIRLLGKIDGVNNAINVINALESVTE